MNKELLNEVKLAAYTGRLWQRVWENGYCVGGEASATNGGRGGNHSRNQMINTVSRSFWLVCNLHHFQGILFQVLYHGAMIKSSSADSGFAAVRPRPSYHLSR